MQILRNKTIILCVLFLIFGLTVGYFAKLKTNKVISQNPISQVTDGSSEFHSGGYELINPLYECNTDEILGTKEFGNLEKKLTALIDGMVASGKILQASVYFRDLNNGPWFGIDEKADFSPSSLLKIPLMIAYFKAAEADPSVLTKRLKYDNDPPVSVPQDYPPLHPLQKGKSYSVEDLIKKMIEGSDNLALWVLQQNIKPENVDKVTLDLGMPTATGTTPDNFMSVKDYSSLFRVLFNASYLNKEDSIDALQILSSTEFKNGLVKLLPKDLVVAHKFGERHPMGGSNQLHDCGIVYYPKHPYLVCVMTKGDNFDNLSDIIANISYSIYKEANSRYH